MRPFLFSGCGKYPELGKHSGVGIGVIADVISLPSYMRTIRIFVIEISTHIYTAKHRHIPYMPL